MGNCRSKETSDVVSNKEYGTTSVDAITSTSEASPTTRERKFLNTGKRINAYESAVVGLEEKIYVFGGRDSEYNVINECWVYQYDNNTWVSLPPMKEKRAYCRAVFVNKKIYVTGGWIALGEGKHLAFASIEIFDCRNGSWTSGPIMKNSHRQHASVAVDGYIYIFGGRNDDVFGGYDTSKCERWNTTSDTTKCWTEIPDMPYKAIGCAAVSKHQQIYVMGGYSNKYLDTVLLFDINEMNWTKQYRMNTPRWNAAAILHNNNICIIGGQSSNKTYESTVEVWSEEKENFIIEKSLVLSISKSDFGILKTNNQQLLAIGGRNKHDHKSSLLQRIDNNTQYSLECAKNAVSSHEGYAVYLTSDDFKESVIEFVRVDGNRLEEINIKWRKDKDVVLAAIVTTPEALKFAEPPLNQDKQLLIKAGLWDEDHDTNNNKVLIVLSTRFSLAKTSTPIATQFAILLKKNEYIQQQCFCVYSPNTWMKNSCDKKWTTFTHPCRGDLLTCLMPDNKLIDGVPQEHETCWRLWFRYQLQKAMERKGFMIQVVEYDEDKGKHIPGDGQFIETDIAKLVGCKVFRAYQPCVKRCHYVQNFDEYNINEVVSKVKEWYDSDCQDMENCNIECKFLDRNRDRRYRW